MELISQSQVLHPRTGFPRVLGNLVFGDLHYFHRQRVEVDRISASISAPNVDKWALSVDIRFRPKAVVSYSVHFRFRQAAVGKFGGCRK